MWQEAVELIIIRDNIKLIEHYLGSNTLASTIVKPSILIISPLIHSKEIGIVYSLCTMNRLSLFLSIDYVKFVHDWCS